jgi:biotin synthase
MTPEILAKAERDERLIPAEIQELLEITAPAGLQALYDCAYRVKTRHVGTVAYLRGLIECGNICRKDCYYCGIRNSNRKVKRFQMDEEEILREALWAFQHEYGSVVIQAGERQDEPFVGLIERILRRIKEATAGNLGITLSLGEQTEATYRRWRAAGAHRYLLRIESSNPLLYASLHPPDHEFETRKHCLALLKTCGYQVGTGVMIGLPGQTTHDLVDDIFFMQDMDVDMVGMGPYIPHRDTPLGRAIPSYTPTQKQAALTLGLKMIAVTRIVLKDINIAAATALQALASGGRVMGLRCGANVIMPNLTAPPFRPYYALYDHKPCLDETAAVNRDDLIRRIESLGETVGFNQWGDPKHFFMRTARGTTPLQH